MQITGTIMVQNILWLALGLLVAAAIIPDEKKIKFKISGIGWVFFGIHWAFQSPHYLEVYDYVNVFLTLATAIISVLLGYVLIKEDKRITGTINGINISRSIFMATTAAAIGGFSYFIFSEIPQLSTWLISTVTDQTVWLGSVFGVMITRIDWNLVAVNGYKVEIILACTAIESIALFMGIIASVNAPAKRLASAFLLSVPVIYILNLIRNVFVVNAYGMMWFGEPAMSFYIAHTIIAKIGSLIALFFVAYAVLKTLPEIIDMIDGIMNLVRGILKNAG